VGEAKAEIARTQGTSEARQELYKVAVRVDGRAVREDDAEPEPLNDDAAELEGGQMVTMAVKELPLVWRTCDEDVVTLSEGGAVATCYEDEEEVVVVTLVTSGAELTTGKHYWEVEMVSLPLGGYHSACPRTHLSDTPACIGVTRPNLNPDGHYASGESTDGWFIITDGGRLFGNGKNNDRAGAAGDIHEGDRAGVLLDLDEGSLRFFNNGVQHGPGYPAGSVTGPVVCALQMYGVHTSVRLLPQDTDHPLLQ
jgi:hypothetical protein